MPFFNVFRENIVIYIVGVLHFRQLIHPFNEMSTSETAHVHLHNAIDNVCLSIWLGVIGYVEIELFATEVEEFPSEGTCKSDIWLLPLVT